jgi:hypothetical protein
MILQLVYARSATQISKCLQKCTAMFTQMKLLPHCFHFAAHFIRSYFYHILVIHNGCHYNVLADGV